MDAARSAVAAFLEYGEVIDDEGGGDAESAARFLQNALTYCGVISRYFWPAKSRPIETHRAKLLRKHFHVEDDSALHSRKLRNDLEHFDEKIDAWIMEFPVGPIVVSPIIGSHLLVDDGFGHAFKIIDTREEIYVVLGKKHAFGSIAKEVARLVSDYEFNGSKSAK